MKNEQNKTRDANKLWKRFQKFMNKELSKEEYNREFAIVFTVALTSVLLAYYLVFPLAHSGVQNITNTLGITQQDNVFTSGNIEVTVQKDIQLTAGERRSVSEFVTVKDTNRNMQLAGECSDYALYDESGKYFQYLDSKQSGNYTINLTLKGFGNYSQHGPYNVKREEISIPFTIHYTVNPKPVVPKTELTLDNVKVDYTATESKVTINAVSVNGEVLKQNREYRVDKIQRTGHHSYGIIRIKAIEREEGKYKGEVEYPFQYAVTPISGKVTISKFLKKYCDTGIWENPKTGKIRIGETQTYSAVPTAYSTAKEGYNRIHLPFIEQARLKTGYTAKVADERYMKCMLDDFAKLSVKEKQSKVCSFLYTDIVKVGNVTGRPVKVYVQAPKLVKNGTESRPFYIQKGKYWKSESKKYPNPLVKGDRIATIDLTWCSGVNGSYFQAEQFEVRYTVKGKKGWKKISKTAIVNAEEDHLAFLEAKGVTYKKAGKIQARLRRTVNGKKYYSKWVKVK